MLFHPGREMSPVCMIANNNGDKLSLMILVFQTYHVTKYVGNNSNPSQKSDTDMMRGQKEALK